MSELKILSYCNIIAKFPPLYLFAVVAQLVEHVIGNDEVTGSIPVNGSAIKENGFSLKFFRAERSSA